MGLSNPARAPTGLEMNSLRQVSCRHDPRQQDRPFSSSRRMVVQLNVTWSSCDRQSYTWAPVPGLSWRGLRTRCASKRAGHVDRAGGLSAVAGRRAVRSPCPRAERALDERVLARISTERMPAARVLAHSTSCGPAVDGPGSTGANRMPANEGRAAVILKFEVRPSGKPRQDADRSSILEAPVFGKVFTDHMVSLRWEPVRGWHDGMLGAFQDLSLPPSTSVFHYGQEIFEGLKAYRQADGSIALFRPDRNAARFNASARRLAMPEMPAEMFIDAVELLVRQDREWVPTGAETSLYLRPFMIATQPTLGFTLPSQNYLFCVIASPTSGYFGNKAGPRALVVWLSEEYARAALGGTGAAKAGGNYAGAFLAQRQAVEQGCDQVVWLDAVEHRWVEEMGGMNLCFIQRPSGGGLPVLMTPALTGTLLPGVTRDSLLHLADRLGLVVEEGRISVDRWREDCERGLITEAFACGTAAGIAPVGRVCCADGGWTIGDGGPGPITLRLRDELLGIQYGRIPDDLNWMRTVC